MTTGPHRFTPFAAGDAAEVVSWLQTLAEARRWAGARFGERPGRTVLVSWTGVPGPRRFVLRDCKRALAYAELWDDGPSHAFEMARLIVDPMHRGRGIAREMVRHLLLQAAELGANDVVLRVAPDNDAATRFYERLGFARLSAHAERELNREQPVEYRWLGSALADANPVLDSADAPR